MPTPTVETNRIATSYGLMDHLTNYASRMGVTLDSKGQLCAKKLSEQIYAFCGNSYTNTKALYCPTPTYCNENYHVSFTDGGINYGANLILNDTDANQLALLSNVTLNYTANLIQLTSLSFSNSNPYTYAINISQFLAHKNVSSHMNFTYTLNANVTYLPTTANYQTSIQYTAVNVSDGQTNSFVNYRFKIKNNNASVKTEAAFTVENIGYYDVYCRVYSAHNTSITAQRRLTIQPLKVTSIEANMTAFPTYIITDNQPFSHQIMLYGEKAMPCPRIVGVTSNEDVYVTERIYGEETLFELADDGRIVGSAPITNVTVKFPYRAINAVSMTYYDTWSTLVSSGTDYQYVALHNWENNFANSVTFFAYNYSNTDNDKITVETTKKFWYIRPATSVSFYTSPDDTNPSNILYMYDGDNGTMYNIVGVKFEPFNCHIKAINFTLKDSSNTDYSSDIDFYPNVQTAWTDVKPQLGWVNQAYKYNVQQYITQNNILIPYMAILKEFQITNAPSTQYTLTCDVTLYDNTHLTATKTYMLRYAKQPVYHIHVDYEEPTNGWTSRYYYIEPTGDGMGVAVKINFYGVGDPNHFPHYTPTIVLGESTSNLYDVTFELDDYYGDTHYYMLAFVVSRETNNDSHYFTITPKFKKLIYTHQGNNWVELNNSQIDYNVTVNTDSTTGHCSFDIDIYEFKYEDIDKYGLLLHDVLLGGRSYRTDNNWVVILPWGLSEPGGGMQPGYELEFDTFLTEYYDEEDHSLTLTFNDNDYI